LPVSRAELVRYRRLLELAQAQRDAVLAGQFGELREILAERQALLSAWPEPGSEQPDPSAATEPGCAGSGDQEGSGRLPRRTGPPVAGEEAGGDSPELAEEARELLRAVLEVDRECQRLVAERLKGVEGDLAATRAALQGSRAYRLCLQAGRVSRVLDELK